MSAGCVVHCPHDRIGSLDFIGYNAVHELQEHDRHSTQREETSEVQFSVRHRRDRLQHEERRPPQIVEDSSRVPATCSRTHIVPGASSSGGRAYPESRKQAEGEPQERHQARQPRGKSGVVHTAGERSSRSRCARGEVLQIRIPESKRAILGDASDDSRQPARPRVLCLVDQRGYGVQQTYDCESLA